MRSHIIKHLRILKVYRILLEGYESYTGIVERRMGEKDSFNVELYI